MDILKDIFMINKTALKKTIKSLKKNWMIIFTGLIYVSLNLVMMVIINTFFRGILFVLAGFIMAIVSSALISNYLYLLSNVIRYNKITTNDFKDGFTQYLRKIYGIFFIAWIGNIILTMLGGMFGSNGAMVSSIVSIVILVALNPLPETIYQKYYSPGESIQYTFEFMKENWVNWFLPNLILSYLLYVVTGRLILDLFTTHLGFNYSFNFKSIIIYLLGQTIFSFMMIYRGHLYKILSTSTRRKRMYMNKFYD